MFGIDEEYRPYSGRFTFSRLEHAIRLRDTHVNVGNDREFKQDARLLMDGIDPCDVCVDAVDAEAQQLGVVFFKKSLLHCEAHHLRGADRREIRRMGEEHHPASLSIG